MKYCKIVWIMLIFNISTFEFSFGQIGDIKGLADGAGDLFSGCSGSDVDAACSSCDCFWNGGLMVVDFLVNHSQEIRALRDVNPTLFSFEVAPQFAYEFHPSHDSMYHYINYLPELRGNIGIFSTDFRFNLLTEYTNDFPDSFKSWEWLFLLNIVPVENFKLTFGTGVYAEMYTEKYYNEHYLELKFDFAGHKSYLDADARVAVDYNTSLVPFLEAGLRYNTRFIDFNHVYAYISLGALYQNYYSSHDIWGARGGIIFNFH